MQWLDVVWSLLVLRGIEKLRIVPGFTEANTYTHSPPGALALSLLLGGMVAMAVRDRRGMAFAAVSAAIAAWVEAARGRA